MFESPFSDVPIWHRFDTAKTDEQVCDELAAIGVILIDREKGILWVDRDNSYTPAIQRVLNHRDN